MIYERNCLRQGSFLFQEYKLKYGLGSKIKFYLVVVIVIYKNCYRSEVVMKEVMNGDSCF